MRSSDGSSDVGASDLGAGHPAAHARAARALPPGWLYPPPSRRSLGSPLSISRARQTRAVRHLIARRRRRLGGLDRKSVVLGKSVFVRVDLGGRRIIKKKTTCISYSCIIEYSTY